MLPRRVCDPDRPARAKPDQDRAGWQQQVFLWEDGDDEHPAGFTLSSFAAGRRSGADDAAVRTLLSDALKNRDLVSCRRDAEVVLLVDRHSAQQRCAGLAVACEGVARPLSEATFSDSTWHRDISSSPYFLRIFLVNCDLLDFESLAASGDLDKSVRDEDIKDIFLLKVLHGLVLRHPLNLFKECTNF